MLHAILHNRLLNDMPFDNEKRIMACDNCSTEMSYDQVSMEYPSRGWTYIGAGGPGSGLVFCGDCWVRDEKNTKTDGLHNYSLSECERLSKMVDGVLRRLESNA